MAAPTVAGTESSVDSARGTAVSNLQSMLCPVCDTPKPAVVKHCSCGYDFATADTSLAIWRSAKQRRFSRHQLRAGLEIALCSVGFIPAAMISPWRWASVLILAGTAVLVGHGALNIVRGGRASARANRQLKAARMVGLLPQARVV